MGVYWEKNNGEWLEKELLKNDAEVNLLAGGIQLISSEHAMRNGQISLKLGSAYLTY